MERPSPVPPCLAAVVACLNVGLKQPLLLKLAEADAGVGDVEAELELAVGGAGIGMHPHRAARGELHGIVGKIGEHLAKADGIALDEARAAHADINGAEHTLLAGAGLQLVAHALDQLMQVEHSAIELEASGLELGIVENVVEHRMQAPRRLLQGLGIAPLRGVEPGD